MHANARAALPPRSAVLVLGAGAVGLLCAAVSRVSGAETVVIADIQQQRVQFAIDNGFADAGVVVPVRRPGPATVEEKLAFASEVAEMAKSALVQGRAVGEFVGTFECTGVESCLQAAIYVRLFFFLLFFSFFSWSGGGR